MTEEKIIENKEAEIKEAASEAPQQEETASISSPKKKFKGGRMVPVGIAFIRATFNNTKVTVTDLHGNVLCWASSGKVGFKGSRKSTAYAAQMVATDAIKKAQQNFGMRSVEARIKGPGPGRESAIRGIVAAGVEITTIRDVTPVPHNGCRPKKRRRI
jgi:small subunit ribosomal protein S11